LSQPTRRKRDPSVLFSFGGYMSRHPSTRLLAIAVLVCATLFAPALNAGTISLAWDPVNHADLAGYRVFYDTVPQAFGSSEDAGTGTAYTLAGLDDCVEYHVAVKAYDSSGRHSEQYSQEVVGWARPTVASVSPAQVERNVTAQLTVGGTNFRPGVQLQILDPGVAVLQITENGCNQLLVDISVNDTAGLGPVDVRVINPDGTYGDGSGLLGVIADATGPAISTVAAGAVGSTTAEISWQTDEPSSSRVHFRLQGHTTYQSTTLDETLVTDHVVQLQGLTPDSTYEYYVESVDSAGNSNVSGTTETFTTGSSQYTFLRLEAEQGSITSPIVTVAGAGTFRQGWIEVPAGTPDGSWFDPAGTAEYSFHVPHDASWNFWVRVYGGGLANDSWFESVDGQALQAFSPPTPGAWFWVQVRSYSLDAGQHMLKLAGAEDRMRADRILVTDDPTFVPNEVPGDDVMPPDTVSGLTATVGDGTNFLSWTNPSGENDIRVVIRYRADGQVPQNPADGLPLAELDATPGSVGSYDHTGLTNGIGYAYSLFVIDAAGNASEPVTVQSTPRPDPPGTVQNVARTDVL